MASFIKFCLSSGSISRPFIVMRKFSGTANRSADQSMVGFIGVGNMGCHMARNLLKKGYPLLVYDVLQENMDVMKKAGAKLASSPAEVADNVTRVVTMLPESVHVQQVYAGKNGLFTKVKKDTLFIDSSTIDPAVSQAMAEQATLHGAKYVDAPVSGGVNAARDGLLTFMVGGTEEAFTGAKVILEWMGKNIVHCGPVGTGQAAKICNNMLLGISMIGTSEAMNLGMKLGLDAKLLAKIFSMGSGRCWSSEVYNPVPGVVEGVPSSNDYKGGFGTTLMTKDLKLAQNAALATHSATPMGSLAHQIYRMMTNQGFGHKDFSSAYEFIKAKL